MIRRDHSLGAGAPAEWLLVSQREHARVSGLLAAAWEPAHLAPGLSDAARAELLAAIHHHDDGWAAWEAAPRIDPAEGRPIAFTEMPAADAQALWTGSIDACRAIGPLAGWLAASHFLALEARGRGGAPPSPEWAPWVTRAEEQRAAWLAEWRALDPLHTPPQAEGALTALKRFDWLSLWLCCLCPATVGDSPEPGPAEPLVLDDTPGLPPVRFAPLGAGRVAVDPWPFVPGELRLSLPAQRVAARRYTSTAELLAEASDSTLAWRLAPAGG